MARPTTEPQKQSTDKNKNRANTAARMQDSGGEYRARPTRAPKRHQSRASSVRLPGSTMSLPVRACVCLSLCERVYILIYIHMYV